MMCCSRVELVTWRRGKLFDWLIMKEEKPRVVVDSCNVCNPSTQEAEVGRINSSRADRLHGEFKASLRSVSRPCLKKKKKFIEPSKWFRTYRYTT
jgi:hypothetical protein